MTFNRISTMLIGAVLISQPVQSADVNITSDIESVTVKHGGKSVTIMRNQDTTNTINPAFAKTSRKCPPFCIQPGSLGSGVETIAELEVLDYLKRINDGDNSIVVVDSRTPDWASKGTIPGAINIPWTKLNPAKGADPITIGEILEGSFNAKNLEGLWDFSGARTWSCSATACGAVNPPTTSRTCSNSATRRTRSNGIGAACRTGKHWA